MDSPFGGHTSRGLKRLWVLAVTPWFGFAPFAGLAAETAAPAPDPRLSVCLNGVWEIAPATDEVKMPEGGWKPARVPAIPITDKNVIGQWYRLAFDAPKEWSTPDRRFFLELEKVGHYAAIFCNGKKVGEHFGQYTPFESDLTSAFKPGEKNEIAVYVHNALGRFVRAGADVSDELVGKAYRAATNQDDERNWIGIVGDVTLSYRPSTCINDVFVETSVRDKAVTATIAVHNEASTKPLTCRATVLDGEIPVFDLGSQDVTEIVSRFCNMYSEKGPLVIVDRSTPPITMTKAVTTWPNLILWGTPPYGEPKLYTLRAELLRDGKVIDRTFTRFGFREVWIEGRDVMLNGKKLWMAGSYYGKLSPHRVLNDRRPLAAMIRTMQAGGLNAWHGHWDDPGRPALELCDEMGVFFLGGFFCDGRPKIQSRADEGWVDWMSATCADWVRARRNHTCILMWRPTDVIPPRTPLPREEFCAKLAAVVRRSDPSHRPLADDSDIVAWGQPPNRRGAGPDAGAAPGKAPGKAPGTATDKLDNFQPLADGAKTGKPFLCKEIYGGGPDAQKLMDFFRLYYQKSFELGSTGMLVQGLGLLAGRGGDSFSIQWLSQSGPGNRDTTVPGLRYELPNWCDPKSPPLADTLYAKGFRDLSKQYMKLGPKPAQGAPYGEALVTGLAPGSLVFLAPDDPAAAAPQGMLTAPDGSAWFVVRQPGAWRLVHKGGSQAIKIEPKAIPAQPGYDNVQRITATR